MQNFRAMIFKKSHIANEQKNRSVRCFREIEPQVQKW